MLPSANKGAGMNIGFPDICVTPVGPAPVPLPYPNFAMNATAAPFSPTVLLSMVPALNMMSMIPMTLGDQAGTLSPNSGPGRYTMGNPMVLIGGAPGINLLCPTTGNNFINPLGAVLVPSITTVFFTDAGRPAWSLDAPMADDAGDAPAVRRAGRTGVVRLSCIPADAAPRVQAALDRLEDADGLLLDLRGNGGGVLEAAIAVAGLFLPRGAPICRLQHDDGDETVVRSRTARPCVKPLGVLVDGGTASAAEVLAAALHGGGAVLSGAATFGKGIACNRGGGRGGDPGRLATMEVRGPHGAVIQGCGLVPGRLLPPEGFDLSCPSLCGPMSCQRPPALAVPAPSSTP